MSKQISSYAEARNFVENQVDLASQYLGYELSFSRFGNSSILQVTDREQSPKLVQKALITLAAVQPVELTVLMSDYVQTLKAQGNRPIRMSIADIFKQDPFALSHELREVNAHLSTDEWKKFLVELSASDQLQRNPPALGFAHDLLDRHEKTLRIKGLSSGIKFLRERNCRSLEQLVLSSPQVVADSVYRYFKRLGFVSPKNSPRDWIELFRETEFMGGDLPTNALHRLVSAPAPLDANSYSVFIEAVNVAYKNAQDKAAKRAKKQSDDVVRNGEYIKRSRLQPKGTSVAAREHITSRLNSPDEPG